MENETLRSSSHEMHRELPATKPAQIKVPIDAKKEQISVLLLNADILIRHGDKDLAKHLARQALLLNPQHPEAMVRLASCMSIESESEQLMRIQGQILKVDNCFKNLANLANSYYRQGNDAQALKLYQEALSTLSFEEFGLFEVYKNMGNILVKERDFEGAEEYYNKAFTLDPHSDVLQVNLGTLDLQREQTENALTRFRRALELNSNNDKAWVGLALVHNSMGDQVLAKANIENAIDLNPSNRTAVQLAAAWALRDHDFENAIEALQNFLSLVDFDSEISILLVHLFCLSGREDLARLELERHLLWEPQSEQALTLFKEIGE